MCGKKAARESQLGIDAVKELMVTEFLPRDRKLKSWSQQRSDLLNLPTKPRRSCNSAEPFSISWSITSLATSVFKRGCSLSNL
mmetsp:Transcript_5912/g.4900  ORF Transcript_5912/g.4900 Transcript_5912/m.4900 type:complete len:83 (-) Transcript_5912:203-451(-)